MARAKRGDKGAYEEIVRRHETIAFRMAWTITDSERRHDLPARAPLGDGPPCDRLPLLLLVRLEGAFERRRAIALARSLR